MKKSENGEKTVKPLVQAPFCSMWFIGLEFQKSENLNVDLTDSIQGFTNSVHKHAVNIKMLKTGMEIEARHVRRKQLCQYLDKDLLNRERKNTEPSLMTLLAAKKRLSSELQNSALKKGRVSESFDDSLSATPDTSITLVSEKQSVVTTADADSSTAAITTAATSSTNSTTTQVLACSS